MNLAKELFVEYEGKFLLSEKFSQDPLEEHFDKDVEVVAVKILLFMRLAIC